MRKKIYIAALALLPVVYVASCWLTERPVEWVVFPLMLAIVGPIIVVWRRTESSVRAAGQAEHRMDARLPSTADDSPPPPRLLGALMLGAAAVIYGAEWVLAHVVFLYLPLFYVLVGPLTTGGALILISPVFAEAVAGSARARRNPVLFGVLRYTAYVVLIAGFVIGMQLAGRARDGS